MDEPLDLIAVRDEQIDEQMLKVEDEYNYMETIESLSNELTLTIESYINENRLNIAEYLDNQAIEDYLLTNLNLEL